MSPDHTGVVLPFIILVGGAFAIYLIARLVTSRNEWLAVLTAMVFGAALGALLALGRAPGSAAPTWGTTMAGVSGMGSVILQADHGAVFVGSIALAMGLCVAVYSGRYLSLDHRYRTYYPLLLLMVTGLLGMVMTTDLFNLYLFTELMSIAAYVLVAFRRRTDTSIEAGFKYLIMGTVGTLTLLMGITLIYRETGVLTIPQPIVAPGVWARAGLACIWVGLGIKSAIVPLHTWQPDAYGRAPSSVSALLSSMIGPFYVLLKLTLALGFPARDLGLGLMVCAMVNMLLGNGMALMQTHTKRLLAYSSIAQLGYVMFSVGVGLRYELPEAVQAGFFLLAAHAAMKGLAFLSKGVCHFYDHTTLVEQLRGTFRRLPVVAVTFSIAIMGLIGIPPLAGFTGKWFILTEVWRAADGWVYAGSVVFLLNTLLSLGYYLPILAMLFSPLPTPDTPPPVQVSRWMIVPLVALALLVIVIGVYPGPLWRWAGNVLTF
ncbi:MAG: proton-conducting transporter membrane subunit [Anaerolineae bacterium]